MNTTDTQEITPLSIFVTDGSSAVGRAVVRRLAASGYRVTAMTDGSQGAAMVRQDGGLPVFADPQRAGEIKSMLAMAKADVVVNLSPLAANVIPFQSVDDDAATLLRSTRAVVEAAQQAGVKFLVHTSHTALYGDTHGQFVDETAPLVAVGEGLTAAVKEAESLAQHSGIPAVVLRTGFVYGPYSQVMVDLTNRMKAGRAISSSDHTANWIHSEDLAEAILQVIERKPAGEIFNIVDDEPASPTEFLRSFGTALGIGMPGRMPGFMARAFSGYPPALVEASGKASNAKARDQLNWQPRFATHREGIEHVLLIWRAESAITAG